MFEVARGRRYFVLRRTLFSGVTRRSSNVGMAIMSRKGDINRNRRV